MRGVYPGIRAATVLAALVLAGTVGAANPASADPKPDPTSGISVDDYTGGGGSVTCTGIATSVHPSGSNAQWEGHINCTAVGDILLRINVYRLVGSGENLRKEWVDSSQRQVIGSYLDLYDGRPCNGTIATRWQLNHYSYWNGIPFVPSPAWSHVTTLNCGA